MPTKSIYSIFKENEKITSKNAKMKHLRENYTPAMGIVLEFTYNNMIKWLLPEGDPPYKKNETPWDNQGALHYEVRRFYLCIHLIPNLNLKLKNIKTAYV